MPAITPLEMVIDNGFTANRESHSSSSQTITTSAAGTLLRTWDFQNSEICDLLVVASINVNQSVNIAREVRVALWIELDGDTIGTSVLTFGSYFDFPTVIIYQCAGTCVGVVKDLPVGEHTLELRAQAVPRNGSPTVTALVREMQSIEFYR